MKQEDKRGKLSEMPFAYRVTADGRVLISWEGKVVKILSGEQAERLKKRISVADEKSAQLILAKVTGNFKRGNERAGKQGE